jgi:hypothetical protein
MAKKEKKTEKGYSEQIEHVQATHPEPWPGIRGRSEEHEAEPETPSSTADRSADSTNAQRQLERDMHEPTRE